MRAAIVGSAVFALGLALILSTHARPNADQSQLPWFEADCRFWIYRGGDPGVVTDFTLDGMRFVVPILDPHRPDRHADSMTFDADGEVTAVLLDWEAFQTVMSESLDYGGGTTRAISKLRREARGLRVNMQAEPACHDERRLGRRMSARIEAQRAKGSR